MKTLGAIFLLGTVSAVFAWWDRHDELDTDSVALGLSVYVSEGCIHCHSQYARDIESDSRLYGPASEPPREGDEVLIGNRRQGPDLSNVGTRRSREWNRAHLIDPALVSPGSRMPSYGYLFEKNKEGGEWLLDYLASLVSNDAGDWIKERPIPSGRLFGSMDVAKGKQLFEGMCVQCHGPDGEGDGKLADSFTLRPANLRDGPYRFAPSSLPFELRRRRLAEIVRFGIPGTAMAGHEYLTDAEIVDLVGYVERISDGRSD